jgi:hypothetical protein
LFFNVKGRCLKNCHWPHRCAFCNLDVHWALSGRCQWLKHLNDEYTHLGSSSHSLMKFFSGMFVLRVNFLDSTEPSSCYLMIKGKLGFDWHFWNGRVDNLMRLFPSLRSCSLIRLFACP